jgi:primosomal protein N' (replication factor Y)
VSETNTGGQLELLRAATRGKKPKPPDPVADLLPVARVAVDLPLPHLDRPFDYAVPQSMAEQAQPGVRVRVRFAGQDVEGYLLERVAASDHVGRLTPLRRVVSPERVLSAEVMALSRAVADRYAGSLYDVLRLAVPPRHARAEQAPRPVPPVPPAPAVPSDSAGRSVADSSPEPAVPSDLAVPGEPAVRPDTAGRPVPDRAAEDEGDRDTGWRGYPAGAALIGRLAAGDSPRAVWTALPGDGWTSALAGAIEATLASGRGALVVLPDKRDVERLDSVLTARLGPGRHTRLEADLGPTSRYRNFLAVLRGDVQVTIGTRAAAFAPVHRLGLVAIWDDGDDLHQEPRAPYPHTREVLALRSELEGAALLAGSWSRSVESAAWLRSGWARPVAADRATLRSGWPTISVASTAFGADDDPAAAGRLPAAAWRAVRDGLTRGPVLVQVPRAGYLPGLSCQNCRKPARCTNCHGPLGFGLSHAPVPRGRQGGDGHGSPARGQSGADRGPVQTQTPECRWCGRSATAWSCPHCQAHRLRATSVGVVRTAEELGRAFSGAAVVVPRAGEPTPTVPEHALVVATPGLEPPVDGGYAAAVLLDAGRLLERPDLHASEDALRRWLTAAALVRPGPSGGKVVICADPQAPAVQSLVRVDPASYAERELDERAELGFPPAVVMAELTGPAAAVTAMLELARLPEGTETLGPIEVLPRPGAPAGEAAGVQMLLRTDRSRAADLATALHAAAAVRSARRDAGAVRIQVDPPNPG